MAVLIATDYRLYAAGFGLDAGVRLAMVREGRKMAACRGSARASHTREGI
jgi:hypothetical protein